MGGETTAGNGTVKRIFVLTDSDLLYTIIKANLQQPNLRLALHNPFANSRSVEARANLVQTNCNHQGDPFSAVDLIIIAHSAHTSEPVVTLAQAKLANQIGRIPILIISDRPFEARPIQQIYHLDFPFDSANLRHTVEVLLAT